MRFFVYGIHTLCVLVSYPRQLPQLPMIDGVHFLCPGIIFLPHEMFRHPEFHPTKIIKHPACCNFAPGIHQTSSFPNLSNPKPGHSTGGSGRGGARRDGGAGRGRAGRDADGSVRLGYNRPSYPPDDRRKPSWACLWKHEQRKSYVNRGNKARGIRFLSAVDPRFIRGLSAGPRALFVPGC